jgi:hypothetical protein
MKKFIFLYKGFVTPTPEIGRAWMEWFSGVGDRMADSGNPMTRGVEVTPNGVVQLEVGIESFTGFRSLTPKAWRRSSSSPRRTR